MGQPLILIVEDDAGNREGLAAILIHNGYQVQTAADGIVALQMVKRTAPRLIILDLEMPIMNGPTFAKLLKGLGIHPPLLVVSARPDGKKLATEIGATGFLMKPFNLDALLTEVKTILAASSRMWE